MYFIPWWRHQMEIFSALLAICVGNSPVPGEFPTQRPVTRSFDVYFDLRPNKRLSKQSWGWWFETLSCSLWRHRNAQDLWTHITLCCNSMFLVPGNFIHIFQDCFNGSGIDQRVSHHHMITWIRQEFITWPQNTAQKRVCILWDILPKNDTLTLKHRETHEGVVSTVSIDALVLKHRAISIHNAD